MNKPEIYLYLYQRFDTTKQQQQKHPTQSSRRLSLDLFICFWSFMQWIRFIMDKFEIFINCMGHSFGRCFFSLKFKLKQVFYFYFDLYWNKAWNTCNDLRRSSFFWKCSGFWRHLMFSALWESSFLSILQKRNSCTNYSS